MQSFTDEVEMARGAMLQKSGVQFANRYLLDRISLDCSGASGVVIFGINMLSYVARGKTDHLCVTRHVHNS